MTYTHRKPKGGMAKRSAAMLNVAMHGSTALSHAPLVNVIGMSCDKDYLSLPLRDLLADTAAKSPTPGGGSVAATVGSLAASLACMVLAYTIGKPKFADHDERLRSALAEFTQAGETFARLIREDMQAYEGIVAARKLDDSARNDANRRAIAVPMEIVDCAGDLAVRLDEIKAIVNPYLAGDHRAAASLARGAAHAAAAIVRENISSVEDAEEATRLARHLAAALERIDRACNGVLRA